MNETNKDKRIIKYLGFMRKQRQQSLIDIECIFQDIVSTKVYNTTYNASEVSDILKDLVSRVSTAVNQELLLHSHMNVLLLQQIYNQADAKNLGLKVQLASIEDRTLLDRVRQFELQEFEKKTENSTLPDPIILVQERQDPALQDENHELKQELSQLQVKNDFQVKEMNTLRIRIHELENEIMSIQTSQTNASQNDVKIIELQAELDAKLENSKAVKSLKSILNRKNELIMKLKSKIDS